MRLEGWTNPYCFCFAKQVHDSQENGIPGPEFRSGTQLWCFLRRCLTRYSMPRADESPARLDERSQLLPSSSSTTEVIGALESNLDPAPADRFRLVTHVNGSYFAVDSAGHACLLVPTIGGASVVGRDVGGLSISHGGT